MTAPGDRPDEPPTEVASEQGQDETTVPVMAEPTARIAEEKLDPAPVHRADPPPAEPQKPLIAVDMASARSTDNSAVRRLPPVAADEVIVLGRETPGGPVPIYPNTGR
jgi:hypothetical protein